MRIIKEPIKNIALLWRKPEPMDAIYRPMRYVLHSHVDDGLLLYNVVTSEMILLDQNEKKVFEGLPAKYTIGMDELIAHHFIVTNSFKEEKSVQELRALLRKINPAKRVYGFTILPTTECNARCYYCFESDHKRCTLSSEMCKDVVTYIEEKCKKKPIDISWFGGEPLVGRKRISQICADLKAKGIEFKSSMVSNAYLFDESIVQEAKDKWNLNNVQITLDGTERVYNETKAYISPKENPFRRVLRNIELLLDNKIAVSVRLNVTDKNKEDLEVLIDLLSKRFGEKKGFSCYSHTVYDGVGFEPLEYDDLKRKTVDAQTADLDAILTEKGLLGSLSRLPDLRYINCMSDNDSCRVIYPDGKIGKCENQSSSENVGDIYNDIIDEEANKKYKETSYIQECEKCCLYPNCLNLSICPETNNCSDIKLSWKLERYEILMKELYIKKPGNNLTEPEDNINAKCV